MFEKDVLQLIRGLRAHKGQEREYIQSSLRECRKEIKSQDMDVKAIALLKLVYLEMFGHDMSWASFHVLEVMSSQKFLQKRVGYLAAVQSFRSDTEVLMLAENLLKKDLGSTDKATISLTLSTIPHVINTGMANSLLTDLIPRMSHSNPTIRKKTIVTLYRLAVVYPEVLRPAWPKIKERLSDENEDPSVTAAIVNVICELGWRRPHDFLPLAPRLFELLTQGNNNWMAIKIIKLFSVLIPIEPRLIRKLLPPLTQLIKTTPAMSLLYECINGIIQGGIMEGAEGTREGDEIAMLCVSKLRGMLAVKEDTNLRYVALLAFAKITNSHARLVAEHQDVILDCIDDADISIRTRALDLAVGMVDADNLQRIVDKLIKQLVASGTLSPADDPENDRAAHDGVIPLAEDEEEGQASLRVKQPVDQLPPLPTTYRTLVVERILHMCTKNMYANMTDFEWYIDVLASLIRQCPSSPDESSTKMAEEIGAEFLNVTIRVKAIRPESVHAAQQMLTAQNDASREAFSSVAFVAGEYAALLPDPEAVLTALTAPAAYLSARTLAIYVQAIPKVFVALTADERKSWTSTRQSHVVLLIARITHFLEPLTLHPALEVQERAVEYLELFRLANEACGSHVTSDNEYAEPPLLLTQAIPALFTGAELNPVAQSAISQIPTPDDLDLDTPINASLQSILYQADFDVSDTTAEDEVRKYYYERPHMTPAVAKPAIETLEDMSSYQKHGEEAERAKVERRERYKDDPYYIGSERTSGRSTPLGKILHSTAGQDDFDVDAIPVMKLVLENEREIQSDPDARRRTKKKPKRLFEITADETLPSSDASKPTTNLAMQSQMGGKKNPLQVDSSGLSTMSLDPSERPLDIEQRLREDEEMARAIKEVERLRLAMQRRAEEIQEPQDAVVVKSKRKKPRTGIIDQDTMEVPTEKAKKKKKKKKSEVDTGGMSEKIGEEDEPKPKRKKKRVVAFDEQG